METLSSFLDLLLMQAGQYINLSHSLSEGIYACIKLHTNADSAAPQWFILPAGSDRQTVIPLARWQNCIRHSLRRSLEGSALCPFAGMLSKCNLGGALIRHVSSDTWRPFVIVDSLLQSIMNHSDVFLNASSVQEGLGKH